MKKRSDLEEREEAKLGHVKKGKTELRILFVGNSFTSRNDVPGLVKSMAEQRDLACSVELVSKGGASLKRHWNAGALENREFDVVVLQEQSTLPVKNKVSSRKSKWTCLC
jgi:hypothetical protein